MMKTGNDWDAILADEIQKEYYLQLREFLKQEYKTKRIYPDMHDIFNSLRTTAYQEVKVVILGQDPYHGPGQAHGYCFSVQPGVKAPPSLVNIYKEIMSDCGALMPQSGNLLHWARQGVLLLNTVLTVQEAKPNSHKAKGWEFFTDRIIDELNHREKPIVFLLWGANARTKKQRITGEQHYILEAAHPSPLSAHNGFFGCQHFSKANQFLQDKGESPIDWQIG